MTIAYFDMVDSCRKIDCILSDLVKINSENSSKFKQDLRAANKVLLAP